MSEELVDLLTAENVEAFNERRNERSRPELFAADLAGKKLKGVDLSGANLEKADITGADLTDANFMKTLAAGVDGTGAQLSGVVGLRARFKDAYLDDAVFNESDFTQGDFADAVLDGSVGSGVCFSQARMRGVSAKGVKWEDCELVEAKLHKSDFSGANLSRGDLTEATGAEMNLAGARLDGAVGTDAKLPEANFEGASMVAVRFTGANLAGAKLMGANLHAADLSRVNLTGADLTGADLSGATLAEACLDDAIFTDTNLAGADLSGVVVKNLGFSEETIASLSAHGVPFDETAPLRLESASFGAVDGLTGVVWINPDTEETKSLRWGCWYKGEFLNGALPVPADTVLDAQMVLHKGALRITIHRVRPDGIMLEDMPFTHAGPGKVTSVSLGYDPKVHPVFREIDGDLYMWGLARRGPTVVVHRLGEEGWEVVHSKASSTAMGFLGGMPVLAGKGGVLTPLTKSGLGDPRRAPDTFPGTHAVAGVDEVDLLCVWSIPRKGDVAGGVRFARIERRGTPDVEVVSMVSGITAMAASYDGQEVVMGWIEAGESGVDETTPWMCRLPDGAPRPLSAALYDAKSIRVAAGCIGVVCTDGSAEVFSLKGASLGFIGR